MSKIELVCFDLDDTLISSTLASIAVNPLIPPGIIADFKSVSNSEFFQAFAGPRLLLKSMGKRGRN